MNLIKNTRYNERYWLLTYFGVLLMHISIQLLLQTFSKNHTLSHCGFVYINLISSLLALTVKNCNFFKIKFTFRMLASAPVLCPDPEEPTLSLSCLPQSEKDKNRYNNKFVKFRHYNALDNEVEILPGWLAIKLVGRKAIATKYNSHIFLEWKQK